MDRAKALVVTLYLVAIAEATIAT